MVSLAMGTMPRRKSMDTHTTVLVGELLIPPVYLFFLGKAVFENFVFVFHLACHGHDAPAPVPQKAHGHSHDGVGSFKRFFYFFCALCLFLTRFFYFFGLFFEPIFSCAGAHCVM
jgi:hypothetical protein